MALGALPTAMRASWASVSGVAHSAAAATWSSVSAPAAQRLVECGQAAQRLARARDLRGGAVVAARDLRQPLRAGGAARCLPVAVVVGLAHDLRQPLREPRLLRGRSRATRAGAPPARRSTLLIDRPFQCGEHTFVSYQPRNPESVPKVMPIAGSGATSRPRRQARPGRVRPRVRQGGRTCDGTLRARCRCSRRCGFGVAQAIRPPVSSAPRQWLAARPAPREPVGGSEPYQPARVPTLMVGSGQDPHSVAGAPGCSQPPGPPFGGSGLDPISTQVGGGGADETRHGRQVRSAAPRRRRHAHRRRALHRRAGVHDRPHHEDAARSLDGARGDRRRSASSSGSTTPTRSST